MEKPAAIIALSLSIAPFLRGNGFFWAVVDGIYLHILGTSDYLIKEKTPEGAVVQNGAPEMASTRTFVFLSVICILGGVGLLFFHGRRKRRGEHTVKWLFYSCVCFALHFATGLLAITMFHVRFVYPCMSQISPCTRKYGTGYFSCMGSLPLSLLSAVLVALKIRKYKRWILLRKNFLAGL